MNDNKMTPVELRATWGLGTVFSLRMLGMFMVLPVLTTYGMALQGASESLIGLAIGIYGLAQAIFQIPFGLLSDRIGRKPLIVGGLLVFVLGSVIAASTTRSGWKTSICCISSRSKASRLSNAFGESAKAGIPASRARSRPNASALLLNTARRVPLICFRAQASIIACKLLPLPEISTTMFFIQ